MIDLDPARRWLDTVEAALVASAMGTTGAEPQALDDDAWDAGVAAVAAKFLAVGTPRTLGLVHAGGRAPMLLAAQCAYAAPREVRVHAADAADAEATVRAIAATSIAARATDLRAACACDIVVVDGPVAVPREWIRAGTHITVLDDRAALAPELLAAARVYTVLAGADVPAGVRVDATLAAVAAGLVDGRQLDELTVLLPA